VKYPKINSLFKREGGAYTKEELKNRTKEQKATRHRFIDEYSCPEFENIEKWSVSEKIDGMNMRIWYVKGCKMTYLGRTDAAQLPPKLLAYLQEHFTKERMEQAFPDAEEVILYGEGHGPKIQNGGYYSEEQRFVLFDVLIGRWWMQRSSVNELALELKIPCVPWLGIMTKEEIIQYVKGYDDSPSSPLSVFAQISQCKMEGIVAQAHPMMLFRDGTPIKFKLKCKDFN